MTRLILVPAAVAVIAVSSIVVVTRAKAHEAPSGWSYPASCCSNRDCREVPASEIGTLPDGYQVKISSKGEVVPYGSSKIKDSPDGKYHWCSHGGTNHGGTICLFVPPPAS